MLCVMTAARRKELLTVKPELDRVCAELVDIEGRIKNLHEETGSATEALNAQARLDMQALATKLEGDLVTLRNRAQSELLSLHARVHKISNFYYEMMGRVLQAIDDSEEEPA